jgi:uncharacterized protein
MRLLKAIVALSVLGLLIVGAFNYLLGGSKGLITAHFSHKEGEITHTSPPYHCEVADSESERAKGLMYRKELAQDRGMIFLMPEESIQSFWMRNTFISLDMLFLNSQCEVVDILESVPVLNDEPRTSRKPAKYVVELLAGSAKNGGIRTGSRGDFCEQMSH